MQAAPVCPEVGFPKESARRGREYDRRDRWQPRTSAELDARVPWTADLRGRRSRRRAECATCRLPMPEWAEDSTGHQLEKLSVARSTLVYEWRWSCACACPKVAGQLNQITNASGNVPLAPQWDSQPIVRHPFTQRTSEAGGDQPPGERAKVECSAAFDLEGAADQLLEPLERKRLDDCEASGGGRLHGG